MDQNKCPFVSIIMPIRNEADFIEKAIKSILENDYPSDKIEILVVDGMSNDGTREIVKYLATEYSRVKLIDNTSYTVPYAMNKGIEQSKGDIVIRIDGHATVAPDFVSQSIQVLNEHPDAWCVGGVMKTIGTTYQGRVIAAAMSSPFGVGWGNFRLGNTEGYTDAVIFGAHRRWVFDKVGMFDEELVRNQDDEFIQRMTEAGAKQYMSPKIRSNYFSRSNFQKLMRQYFQYGFWRIRTIQKRKAPARLRQLVPLCFVLGWIALILATCLYKPLSWLLAACIGFYLIMLIVGTAYTGYKVGYKQVGLLPVAFAIMHFAYGLGSLVGVWAWIILKGEYVRKGAAHKLSR